MKRQCSGQKYKRGGIGRAVRAAVVLALVWALCAVAHPAFATEGGGGAYPNGAEGFMAGAVPPPGTYVINYFNYYAANKLVDDTGNSSVPDFKLRVMADVLRVIHVTDKKFLGGFWGMHIFIPVVGMDVKVPFADDRRVSLGDIIVDPFILSWHGENWHVATGLDIYIPTGSFNTGHIANPGRNYWTFEPIVAGTLLLDGGFELSGKFMYDINTKNNATGYTSGHEFHVDYAIAKKIADFTLGVTGYYYQQVSNDALNGVTVPLKKGRVFAVGPGIKYDYKNMSFIFKYDFENFALNRPEGENLWFKFIYAF